MSESWKNIRTFVFCPNFGRISSEHVWRTRTLTHDNIIKPVQIRRTKACQNCHWLNPNRLQKQADAIEECLRRQNPRGHSAVLAESFYTYRRCREQRFQRAGRLRFDLPMTVPASNATVERIFSMVTFTKTKSRNKIKPPLLESILRIRSHLHLSKKCCIDFVSTKAML